MRNLLFTILLILIVFRTCSSIIGTNFQVTCWKTENGTNNAGLAFSVMRTPDSLSLQLSNAGRKVLISVAYPEHAEANSVQVVTDRKERIEGPADLTLEYSAAQLSRSYTFQ
jgi:hypothetical protein